MPVPCFLVAHPKGTLMWDVGVIPDADCREAGVSGRRALRRELNRGGAGQANAEESAGRNRLQPGRHHLCGDLTRAQGPLRQLESVRGDRRGWSDRPSANSCGSRATSASSRRSTTSSRRASRLRSRKTNTTSSATARSSSRQRPVIRPGHQVLVLRLASTGRVMLGGDLYHYPPERTLRRAPPDNEFNVQQSAASRAMIEEYLTQTKTTIWIEHDFATIAELKKSPCVLRLGTIAHEHTALH